MSKHPAILIMLHCEEHNDYAIPSLEHAFHQAALRAGYTDDHIFWSFNGLENAGAKNKINCNYRYPDANLLIPYLRDNNIQTVIAFDLGYPVKVIGLLKDNGVKKIISYWGASMSSINSGIKLWIKKAEFLLRRDKPDHFVFESCAMRNTATNGRGIPKSATSVIYLGVNTEKFFANYGREFYAHEQLSIPEDKKIVFYSGHMEERKGVRTIIKAAMHMADSGSLNNIHFVLCGNKGDEAKTYTDMLTGTAAESKVTFAGYRDDIAALMRSSAVGVIASTGWDSFTMSSVEMMASGLPLIVSNLQGLSETIENDKNGYLITPGDHIALAKKIALLCNHRDIAVNFSVNSRQRAEQHFALPLQIRKMAEILTLP